MCRPFLCLSYKLGHSQTKISDTTRKIRSPTTVVLLTKTSLVERLSGQMFLITDPHFLPQKFSSDYTRTQELNEEVCLGWSS